MNPKARWQRVPMATGAPDAAHGSSQPVEVFAMLGSVAPRPRLSVELTGQNGASLHHPRPDVR